MGYNQCWVERKRITSLILLAILCLMHPRDIIGLLYCKDTFLVYVWLGVYQDAQVYNVWVCYYFPSSFLTLVSLFYSDIRDENKLCLENNCEDTLNPDLEKISNGAMYLKYKSWREMVKKFLYMSIHACTLVGIKIFCFCIWFLFLYLIVWYLSLALTQHHIASLNVMEIQGLYFNK